MSLFSPVLGGAGEACPSSLEEATILPGDIASGRALVSIYPTCGEATVCGMSEHAFGVRPDASDGPSEEFLDAQDPDRRHKNERSASEAARRSRRMISRFCVANRLRFMWTLTFAVEEWDVDQARGAVVELMAALAERTGGPFPYLYVFELHPGTDDKPQGHGLHVHMAIPMYVGHDEFTRAWGRGHCWVTTPGRRGTASAVAARSAARYLAKYVDKSIEDNQSFGRHRYEVAQGFQPECVRVRRWNLADGVRYVIEQFGRQPSFVWSSHEDPDWLGPPCCRMWFEVGGQSG
jgi:hypothetical protein